MREYTIKSTRKGRDYIWGTLYYSDKTSKFHIKFRCALDEMKKDKPPAMIHRFMTNGRTELDAELSLLWVSERIIPKDRQNIADILRENNLTTYREIDMLELSMGKCTLDDIYLTRICPGCGKEKKLSEFGYRTMENGEIRHQSWCKECRQSTSNTECDINSKTNKT